MAAIVKLQTITVANIDVSTEVTTWLNANPITTLWQVLIEANVFFIFYT